MLTIRLQRRGTKHRPFYRVVVAEKARHVSKKFKEILGTYHPVTKEFVAKDLDRINFYLENNVETSDSVKSIFLKNKIIKE